MSEITRVPHSPTFVEGIINLRGKIVVIINLLKRFGTFKQDEHKGSHVIISNVEGNSFGIMVDGVEEVRTISKKDTRKAPGIISQKIHAEYLKGIGILDDGKRLLILIDLEKILGEKEMLEMAKLTEGMEEKAKEAEKQRKAEEEAKEPKISDAEIESKFKESFSKTGKKISGIRNKHGLKKLKPGLRKVSKPKTKVVGEMKVIGKEDEKEVKPMEERKFEDEIEKKVEETSDKIKKGEIEKISPTNSEEPKPGLDEKLEKEKQALEEGMKKQFEGGGKI